MNEDIMITDIGRARAIYDELNDRWEVEILSENRSGLRKVHDEVAIFCESNDMRLGILQQKTVKYDKIEQVRVDNPEYQSEKVAAKIHAFNEQAELTDEELAEKQKAFDSFMRRYNYHERAVPEWSAKCLVWRGSQ